MTAVYLPDRETFAQLARTHAVVPVWREVLADLFTPLAVYERLRHTEAGPTFLLESVEQGERWGRHSFLGMRPLCTLTARGGRVTVDGDLPRDVRDLVSAAGDDGVLSALESLTRLLRVPALKGLPPFHTGFVGYLGWDVVREIERLPAQAVDDLGLDDLRLVLPGLVVAFDHLRQRLFVVANAWAADHGRPDAYDAAVAAAESLVQRLAAPVGSRPMAPPRAAVVDGVRTNMTPDDFLGAVETAKEHIRAGDVFQVVPAQRFALETDVDPLLVYRVLRVINPSPYLYVFEWDDLQVVGSSPESLVTVVDGQAHIWPIAGSRRRDADAEADEALEVELLGDAKERAEHVMLVDLARNDLGRVCEVGSVAVNDFMQVVRYSHVMHLVSVVSGRVRPGLGPVDVLRATFPAGTLSGAPKVRAMEIIDALEPTRRGLYGGGIGYLDLAGEEGNLDLCIAIRTLVFTGGCAYVQAGAGIVADSVPQAELEESRAKSMALLSAVRAAEGLRDDAP